MRRTAIGTTLLAGLTCLPGPLYGRGPYVDQIRRYWSKRLLRSRHARSYDLAGPRTWDRRCPEPGLLRAWSRRRHDFLLMIKVSSSVVRIVASRFRSRRRHPAKPIVQCADGGAWRMVQRVSTYSSAFASPGRCIVLRCNGLSSSRAQSRHRLPNFRHGRFGKALGPTSCGHPTRLNSVRE
jgi:hypothetical protein